jgi:membrane protein DedA with SNARE-associated domain
MAGAMVGYGLGLRFGRAVASRFVGESELQRVATAHERFGDPTLVALRAVPVLAEASVVLAGLSRMPLGRFVLLTALANLGIAATYATVGAFAVNANSFLLAFAGSIVLPGSAILLARLFSRS